MKIIWLAQEISELSQKEKPGPLPYTLPPTLLHLCWQLQSLRLWMSQIWVCMEENVFIH